MLDVIGEYMCVHACAERDLTSPHLCVRLDRTGIPAAHSSWCCGDRELTLAAATQGLPWKGSTHVSSRYRLCVFDMWHWLGECEPGHGY